MSEAAKARLKLVFEPASEAVVPARDYFRQESNEAGAGLSGPPRFQFLNSHDGELRSPFTRAVAHSSAGTRYAEVLSGLVGSAHLLASIKRRLICISVSKFETR